MPILKAYPNPFNSSITIEFTIPYAGLARVIIYNIAGQKVSEISSEHLIAGMHRRLWDGKDDSGRDVSAGFYIARLRAGEKTATGKLMLVR